MNLVIVEIAKRKSKYGGDLFVVFFEDNKKKKYYTYLSPKKMNYRRWRKVLRKGNKLKGLKLLKGRKDIIDADSKFETIKE